MIRHRDEGWSNPKVLAILAILFICGAAFGSAITSVYLHARILPARPYQDMEAVRHIGLGRLKVQLNLTPDQEKIVMKELDDYAKYYQNIEDEREDVAEHGKQRILDVLTPDQRTRFRAIFGDSGSR